MNRPAWQVHKEERRVINAEKYPRSQRVFTDMHINMHSGQERKYPRKELHSIGMHSEKEKK